MARTMTGAEMVTQALIDQGVEHVFGYPGGAVLPIYDEIFQQDKVRHILVRQEGGAVHAAEGYARATGKVGVVLVTSGPGATNAVTGLTDALMDSIPIVVLTGQVPTFMIGSDAFQEADVVGITRMNPDWVFEDREVPRGEWVIMLGRRMDYEEFSKNIKGDFVSQCIEVIKSYVKGQETGYELEKWIKRQGYYAAAKGGLSDDHLFLVIPAAIEAGLGQLGKHGSMISDELGSSFRLTPILTDMPLVPDQPRDIGVDDFCATCQLCIRDCPTDAIADEKQMVRGDLKWYVDFDKCVPAFNELYACGLCLAVCPWSLPGVAPKLTQKMLRRRERKAAQQNTGAAGG